MVNSKKKMNKSTVAIVVLALLLVLSLVLTATGAWFTDKDSVKQDSNLQFGKVAISLDGTTNAGNWTNLGTAEGNVMPGSSYTGTITLTNDGDEDVWVRIGTQTATLTIGNETITGVDSITVTFAMDTTGGNKGAEKKSDEVYGLAAGAKQDFVVTVTIDGATTGNTITVGDKTVTLNNGTTNVAGKLSVELAIDAVQKANNADASFPTTVEEAKANAQG